ncbi:unnamed protein product [Hydatigera taeniaeformis]|uniref:Rho-GAP domain-containing protein n=1 Tax=Hydatigena taeniaeformis TaxID=6205 RepID=A0A0R3X225_HYDTA|nr:unnamed protein product [Hydatigera taeniaeformis]
MIPQCNRNIISTSSAKKLQDTVIAYADRLAATTPAIDLVNLYRNQRPQQFIDLCKFHLSLLVELPVDFNNYDPRLYNEMEFADDAAGKHRRNRPWTRLTSSMGQGHKTDLSAGDLPDSPRTPSPNAIYENVVKLMDHLSTSENLKMEMIFRKSGNIVRQRELSRCILSGMEVSFPVNFVNIDEYAVANLSSSSSAFSWNRKPRRSLFKVQAGVSDVKFGPFEELKGHDYANTLKNVLREMHDPILTRELLPIFISISKITSGNTNDEGVQVPLSPADLQVAQAKQLMAIRILRFFLPERNQRLLRRLLDLLTETLSYAQFNGMSAESLGTIFGPLLLAPTCYPNSDLHKQYDLLNSLTTLMVKQGSEGVFGVPVALADDIDRNLVSDGLLNVRSSSKDSGLDTCSTTSSGHDENAKGALSTGLVFVKKPSKSWNEIRSGLCNVGLSITECAVAELCATVQALPDSDPRKARLVQRINNSNGGLTPQMRKRLRGVLSPPPLFTRPASFHRLEAPLNGVLSVALEKHPLSGSLAMEMNGGIGSEVHATHSSSSLNADNVTSLCCPLFSILSSTTRLANQQTKQVRREYNSHKQLGAIGSPVFDDMGAPIAGSSHRNPGIRAAGKISHTKTIMATRRHTYLQRMRVRRNYNRNKIGGLYATSITSSSAAPKESKTSM